MGRRLLGLTAALLLALAGTAHAQTLYGSDGPTLYTIDPATAAATPVGPVGYFVAGLAVNPVDGGLWAVTAAGVPNPGDPPRLIRIDKATGAGTMTSYTTPSGRTGDSMSVAIAPDGWMYVVYTPSNVLARIDLTTMQVQNIGNVAPDTVIALTAKSDGTLWAAAADNGPLSTIDKATGAATPVATLQGAGSGQIDGLAFDQPGALFAIHEYTIGVERTTDLVTIDPATGALARKGTLPSVIALAFDRPAPVQQQPDPAQDPGPGAPGDEQPPSSSPGPGTVPSGTAKPGACANRRVGTASRDVITGTDLGDLIEGLAGDDSLNGGAGADCLRGGAGHDKLSGGSGKDTLDGGTGNDKLSGGTDADVLRGGAGNDAIAAGQGRGNSVSAGGGADVVNVVNGKRDTVNCGTGRDTVRADRTDRLRGCERRRFVR